MTDQKKVDEATASRTGPPLKETEADKRVAEVAYRVTANELRSFVERIERLDAEKDEIAGQRKEVLEEAKGRGYCKAAIGRLVKRRKADQAALAEAEAVDELYRSVLGM